MPRCWVSSAEMSPAGPYVIRRSENCTRRRHCLSVATPSDVWSTHSQSQLRSSGSSRYSVVSSSSQSKNAFSLDNAMSAATCDVTLHATGQGSLVGGHWTLTEQPYDVRHFFTVRRYPHSLQLHLRVFRLPKIRIAWIYFNFTTIKQLWDVWKIVH